MSVLPNQTFISPGVPLYGNGGGGPTVSSFETASISSLTISSLNGASIDALDPQFWSYYPAQVPIDAAGQYITNTQTVYGVSSISSLSLAANESLQGTVNLIGSRVIHSAPSTIVQDLSGRLLQANQILAQQIGISSLTASTITVNELVALSTIHAISTISSSVLEVAELVGVSSINGIEFGALSTSADWSLFPAVSSVNMANNDILGANDIYGNAIWAANASTNTQLFNTTAGENFALMVQRSFNASGDTETFITTGGAVNGFNLLHVYNTSTLGQITINSNGLIFYDASFNAMTFNQGLTTSSITVSSINGSEFTTGGVILSSIVAETISSVNGTFNNIGANGFSTVGAAIKEAALSTVVFSPSLGDFSVNWGMGDFLGNLAGTLGAGLFGVAVGVPVTAGTITYGLTKGIASLFEPRPVNNIDSNVFEVFNYQSQLQVSTIPYQVSTIYRFTSTIPSTIQINSNATFSTVSETNIEIFISTLSDPAPVTCMRAIGDPLQTVSTPWSYSQGFGQWVPLPAQVGSNVSSFTLSTLQLGQSTLLRGSDLPGGVLEVFEAPFTGAYGQVIAQGFSMSASNGASTGTLYYQDSNDRPGFLDNDLNAHTLAFLSDITPATPNPIFSTVQLGPSTLIEGSVLPGAVFTVLEVGGAGALGQVLAQGITCAASNGGSNGSYLYSEAQDRPLFLDNSLGSHTIAYTSDIPAFNPSPTFSSVVVQFNVQSGDVSTGSIECGSIQSQGQITSFNSINVVQGTAPNSAFASLVTSQQQTGDAAFYGVAQTPGTYGIFVVRADSEGVDIINGSSGFQQCVLNVGSNGAINLWDPNSNLAYFSANTFYAANANVTGITATVVSTQSAAVSSLVCGSLNYASPTSIAEFGGSRDGTLEVTLQNKSTGSNATAFFFAVDNTGGEYAGFGVNSLNLSNLYSTLFELPGASIQSGTLDCVIGPQSDHSSNSGIYLTYQDGAFAHHINSNGALSFNASYDGTVSEGNFGASNSLLQTNGLNAAPSWVSTVTLDAVSTTTLAVSTINGQVFPINYATYYSDQTVPSAGSNVVNPALCDIAQYDVYGNFSNTASTVTLPTTGTYEINTSIQFATSTNTPQNVYFWFQRNGSNIANSASVVGLTKDGNTLGNLSLIEQFIAGDTVGVVWESVDLNVSSLSEVASGNRPAVPSHILSIKQIGL